MNEQDERMKLFIALQPKFREAMGPLQHGDRVLLKNDPIDDFYCIDCLEAKVFSPRLYEGCLRLPLPIDPRNPERGLWGMCERVVTIGKQIFKKDSYFVTVRLLDANGEYDKFVSFKGNTPELAILKALAHQEGVTP